MNGWGDAFVVLSRTHEDQFGPAYTEAVDPGDMIVTLRDWVRIRVRDPLQEASLPLPLPGDLGQRCRVRPGLHVLPPEHWPEFRDAIGFLNIQASVVAWVCMRLEYRHRGALDALRAALLRRAPVFGST